MQLILNIPDDLINPIKEKLAGGPTGVLQAVAMDAILGYLMNLDQKNPSSR